MRKYDLVTINLDPTVGHEIKKTRPCLVISPDEMNVVLGTIIIVPLTSAVRNLPTRILIKATAQSGLTNDSYAVLDQVKTVDKSRVIKQIGTISAEERLAITDALLELFDY